MKQLSGLYIFRQTKLWWTFSAYIIDVHIWTRGRHCHLSEPYSGRKASSFSHGSTASGSLTWPCYDKNTHSLRASPQCTMSVFIVVLSWCALYSVGAGIFKEESMLFVFLLYIVRSIIMFFVVALNLVVFSGLRNVMGHLLRAINILVASHRRELFNVPRNSLVITHH